MFTILYVAIPLRNRLLSYTVLQYCSDLRDCEHVPDGLPRMVRIALFCTLSIWSDSCLVQGSQTVGQYSRWDKTSNQYIESLATDRFVISEYTKLHRLVR